MSSPNLNVLTLFGSVLTYSSGFLFAVGERSHSGGGASTAVLQVRPAVSLNTSFILLDRSMLDIDAVLSLSLFQARMWTLCVGSTLVFGPILGKTWRLYRVFTQRVPDKRVVGLPSCCFYRGLFFYDGHDFSEWYGFNKSSRRRCMTDISVQEVH